MSDQQSSPIQPLTNKQLQPILTTLFNEWTQTILPANETFDTIRSDYICSILIDSLVRHANQVMKKPNQITKLETTCMDELRESLETNLEEELETKFGCDSTTQRTSLNTILRQAIDAAYGRRPSSIAAAIEPTKDTTQASSISVATPTVPSTTASGVSPTNNDDASSPIGPLVDLLSSIFPTYPRIQVEAVLLACGGDYEPEAAMDLSGEVLAQCASVDQENVSPSQANRPQHQQQPPSDSDPWPSILASFGADEKQIYRQHLQANKYRMAKLGNSIDSKVTSPTAAGQQFYYDLPEPSLKRQTSTSSTSSTSSSSTSAAPKSAPVRDAYYDSAEYQQLKNKLVEQYTYDQSKEGTFHKPHVKYESRPKQHKRYLDNQIVNTRGEKFTVIVDPEEAKREAEWKASHKPLKVITKKKGGVGYKIL